MGRLLALLSVIMITVYIQAVKDNTAQVDVRAVLISCEPVDGQSVPFENDALRFEREELYKHSVLRECKKKLALTIKFASDPDLNSGDEYIPIEHVFQGPMKRVRLFNPYVLRLRREPPVQAYKLRKIDHNVESSDETVADPKQILPLRSESNGLDSNDPIDIDDESSPALVLDDKILGETVNINDKRKADGISYAGSHNPKTKKPEPNEVNSKIDWPEEDEPNSSNQIKAKRLNGNTATLGEYDMYEIGNADLWYTIQVQLFEKLTTPEGKTAWKDLTMGKPARVSSLCPEWTGQGLSILYKPSEWIPREGFTLPLTSLCLLAPVSQKSTATLKLDSTAGQYIVVPREDIVGLSNAENDTTLRENDDRLSGIDAATDEPGKVIIRNQFLRRVLIRSSRALFGDDGVKVHIVTRDGDQYLTMVHRLPYHVQIDVEARADGNQLVHVGSLGRIMTVVADSSRRTRTALTVQATNTGLVAARFKVIVRDCNPELPELMNEKINEEDSSFVVLPPKHTQSTIIDLSAEIPAEVAHCSVALINGDHQSVAVRDVTIRKGDRCFCVWHCECVCLGEDPKLTCREMVQARQVAAGLAVRERTRLIRTVCYHDVLTLNFCLTAFGVAVVLLLFGLMKACLGLGSRWIGMWGLARMLQMPRKLDHYYEPALRERSVLYDEEGWPVHPDTKQRTVRLISMPMEFLLNSIFFLTAPCVLVYEGLKQLCSRCKLPDGDESSWSMKSRIHKRCYSSRENIVQNSGGRVRRRGPRLQRWMSPEAETLTSHMWQEGLPTRASMIRDYMRPLLCEGQNRGSGCAGTSAGAASRAACADSCVDSELDDTEYVLMQMQKSRDSLAKSQRKLNGSSCTMENKQ